jgi:1,4-dihydroxy-6-naphthoate synthase
LGGIVGKKNIDENILKQVDSLIKKSIEYSFSHYPFISDYIKEHSQEMEEEVMKKHIDLYVNDYTIDLGEKGKNAIDKFIEIYNKNHHVERPEKENIFL